LEKANLGIYLNSNVQIFQDIYIYWLLKK